VITVLLGSLPAWPATVVVTQFQNRSPYSDLSWVGESVAGTLMTEFAGANQIVLSRTERDEGERRLSLRPGVEYTEASLIRLGETLDADTVCFGNFTITLPKDDVQLKDSSIRISAQFLDLRHMHLGPEISEAGKLAELSRLEEHLSYEALRYLEPKTNFKLDQFLAPGKTVRLEAEESYVRGLLSSNKDQRQKWFLQAVAVDSKFSAPLFELGKLALEQKQYAQAIDWFGKVPRNDPNYLEARFKSGLASYNSNDFGSAVTAFKEVVQSYPLSEVYNDLGAAEAAANQGAPVDEFRHALESEPHNSTYLFNLGLYLLKTGAFDEAVRDFNQLLQHSDDADARAMLDRARSRQAVTAADKLPPQRLKSSFNETAFRQLKAIMGSEG
jgi:tetratricopeptide (TPR) repeat protein